MMTDAALHSETTAQGSRAAGRPEQIRKGRTVRLPGIAFCAAAGLNAKQLFAGLADFAVHQIDLSGDEIATSPLSETPLHSSYVTGIVVLQDEVISGGYDRRLIWSNPVTGEPRLQVEDAHDRWIRMLQAAPNRGLIVSVGDDMRTRIRDVSTGQLVADWSDFPRQTPHGYPSMLYAVAVSADERWVATANRTGQIVVRDLETHEVAARLEAPTMYTWDPKARRHSIGGVRSLRFSDDGQRLAVGGMGQVGNIDHLQGPSRLEVFNWQAGEKQQEIENSSHKGLVEVMRFGPEGDWLLAAGGDHGGFLCLYDVSTGKVIAQEKAPMHVHDVVTSLDARSLITVGHEQGVEFTLAAAESQPAATEEAS